MNSHAGLARFAYQKRPVAKYGSDSAGDSSANGRLSANRLDDEARVSYLRKLYPEIPRTVIERAVDQADTLSSAQAILLRYLDAANAKRRKRVRVLSDSSDGVEGDNHQRDHQQRSNDEEIRLGNGDCPEKEVTKFAEESVFADEGGCESPSRLDSPADMGTGLQVQSSSSNEDTSADEDSMAMTNTQKTLVVNFFNDAPPADLLRIPSCSAGRAAAIAAMRPFSDWSELKQKFSSTKHLSMALVQHCWQMLETRQHVNNLISQCQDIALRTSRRAESLLSAVALSEDQGHVVAQPSILNPLYHLTHYQMVGLNWLLLMYSEKVNALLADEMGLGKTCQTIAFLAYLLEAHAEKGPHIIVVPTSTLDNWSRELHTWCPSLKHLVYSGHQTARAELRQCFKDGTDEGEPYNILLTTYDFITSTAADRSLYKKNEFHCAVFDEAHALKNMASKRFANLMKVQARHRLLLTGTPVQNNLVELMSLLCFVMPHVFIGREHNLVKFFTSMAKTDDSASKLAYEAEQIANAKKIMGPFVLRRLKKQILTDLPKKDDRIQLCRLPSVQLDLYCKVKADVKAKIVDASVSRLPKTEYGNLCMQLRKAANHSLLLRSHYDLNRLELMAAVLLKDPSHTDADKNLVVEDMEVMSDFELHQLCRRYKCLSEFSLPSEIIVTSAKMQYLDSLLPELRSQDDRVLIFSQFTSMMSILEAYLSFRGHSYLRLDGSTSSAERQQLIDRFNSDRTIFVFLLSTKAGGVGINLTSANCVIIHDIDYNPYNDRQAEDRCHRLGQTREVKVIRLIAEDTVEVSMLQLAADKLRLDEDIQHAKTDYIEESIDLLKMAVGEHSSVCDTAQEIPMG